MSKAILVLDEVKECEDCDLFYIGDFGRSCPLVDIKNDKKPSYCPLKELPKKKATSAAAAIHLSYENNQNADLCLAYNIGFNDCLDTIIGQED